MSFSRTIAVLDIGKTNAKVALADLETLSETAVRKVPNPVRADGPYPHFDTEAVWEFFGDSLAALHRDTPFDTVAVTAHGAAAALLAADGSLAMPILDYEHDGPDGLAAEYDALRPPFAETGTPRLPGGLNVGAQLFWQERTFPELWAKAKTLVFLPQYWSHRLTGVAACEYTAIGAHTDLWNPRGKCFSGMVARMGWTGKLPPLRRAGDRLGPLRPGFAKRFGLEPDITVLCGIHDSNASLYPHLLTRKQPFAVVSTGTWVIMFAVGGLQQPLDPARDTLVNVNALTDPVPSARFMGGREYEVLTGNLGVVEATEADCAAVLAEGIFLLPTVLPGAGAFPEQAAAWLPREPAEPGRQLAAITFYLACMTATSLELIGAEGPAVVEGPFARNELFGKMLSAATGRAVVNDRNGGTGTSIGAALLASPVPPAALQAGIEVAAPSDPAWSTYARRWRAAAEGRRLNV